MKIYNTAQSFKGISNPITNLVKAQNGYVHVLSVQVDNIGTKDLNTFKEIKRMLNFNAKDIEDDVLTITQAELSSGNFFHVNGKPVLLGGDLKKLSRYKFKSETEKQEYKNEESAHIKLYTFIADITKRMSNIKVLDIDEDMHHVAQETFANLMTVFNYNQRLAHNIVYNSLLRPKPFQEHAFQINRFVQETMETLLL